MSASLNSACELFYYLLFIIIMYYVTKSPYVPFDKHEEILVKYITA
jgi:hypothetical protein